MPKFIFPKDTKVAGPSGVHTLFFAAQTPRDVPDPLVASVVAAGGVEAGVGEPVQDTSQPEAGSDQSLQEIVAAMRSVLEENKPELLTGTGMPRASEVEKRLGRGTTRKERDAAWEQVEV